MISLRLDPALMDRLLTNVDFGEADQSRSEPGNLNKPETVAEAMNGNEAPRLLRNVEVQAFPSRLLSNVMVRQATRPHQGNPRFDKSANVSAGLLRNAKRGGVSASLRACARVMGSGVAPLFCSPFAREFSAAVRARLSGDIAQARARVMGFRSPPALSAFLESIRAGELA